MEIATANGVGVDTAEKLRKIMQKLENAEYTGLGMATTADDIGLVHLIRKIDKEAQK